MIQASNETTSTKWPANYCAVLGLNHDARYARLELVFWTP
jgi:hypothetical protein